ncbi:antitoxin [Mycobacterium xenopi]|uniref:antitoxin n=1 Tax=Mycobacterium xenopi TaxID=1789 RepID=UPI000A21C5E7|nr:antitoxin [Mycobacterium xenopi]
MLYTVRAVKERARGENRFIGEGLSGLARQALTKHDRQPGGHAFHGFQPLPHRGAAVSNELIDRLRDDEPV